jgi:drug/metabolite transporter (DMT)-like permease
MKTRNYATNPFFNVMMFSVFWAIQIIAAKLGFNHGAMAIPFQIILFITTMVTLTFLIMPRSGADLLYLFKNKPALFWKLFLANAVQSGLGTCLSIIGISLTETINAGFLVKLATVSTIIFAWIFLKERLSLLKISVVVIALSGAYLLTTQGQRLLPQVGDLFILGACVCWSFGNVIVRKVLKTQSVKADVVTMQKPIAGFPVLMLLIGFSVIFPRGLGNLSQVLTCCSLSASFLPYAVVSGFCLAMAWIFLYRTLNVATASYMTLMSMVTPIIVSILAIFLLGERMVLIQVAGAGMIILSGVVVYLSDISTT